MKQLFTDHLSHYEDIIAILSSKYLQVLTNTDSCTNG